MSIAPWFDAVHQSAATGESQAEALGLFRSAGYLETSPFSTGVFTRYWLAKPLADTRDA